VERWSFLTNHARVLVCIAHDPGLRLRDIAERVGITERSAYAIVSDLTEAGYVVKEKDGRRNRYQIQPHQPLREPNARETSIGEVLDLLVGTTSTTAGSRRRRKR
jgi:DNA-binding IscR family transcriptional regulator